MLTLPAIAKQLGVSMSTVRRLCDRGELAYVRVAPRCIRVHEAELERFVRQSKGKPCPSAPTKQVDTPSNFDSAAAAYIADVQRARQKPKQKRSKQKSGTISLRLVTSA